MTSALDPKRASRIRRRLLAWYDTHKRDLPWRRTPDPYHIWLSEMMLQQTQVATVLPYYARFLSLFPTVQHLADAPLDRVLKAWAGLGYYARARNLHKAAKMVTSCFDGAFPGTAEGLRQLPGVGRYSGGAIASIAFNAREPLVDGNVARVFARLFKLRYDVRRGRGLEKVWAIAEQLLPRKRCGDFNQALMELGATRCLPGEAVKCSACPLVADCFAHESGMAAKLPIKTRATPIRSETHVVAAIESGNRWLVVRRPQQGLWGGLWELPTTVLDVGGGTMTHARKLTRDRTSLICRVQRRPFCQLSHPLTHRKILFVGHLCRITPGKVTPTPKVNHQKQTVKGDSRWLSLDEMAEIGMSQAMRKVVAALQATTQQ